MNKSMMKRLLNWGALGLLSASSFSFAQELVRIEAESYQLAIDTTSGNDGSPTNCGYGGLNVDVENTSDEGAGCNIGWIDVGEWLQYSFDAVGGEYNLSVRVASDMGQGAYQILIDGQVIATDTVGNTGGWQSWETHDLGLIDLSAGTHTLRVEMTGPSFNINWLEFAQETPPADEDSDGVPDSMDQCLGTELGISVDATGCPADSDDDGVIDDEDICPGTQAGSMVDSVGCAIDSDGDGVDDGLDQCPNTPSGTLVNSNGCEISPSIRVEAEDYAAASDSSNGNEAPAPNDCVYNGFNVDVGDTDDEGGGCSIGWIEAGESLTYDISLSAGTYSISSRVASDLTGGAFELYLDGNLIATDSIPSTGGWGSYETHQLGDLEVAGGDYTLHVEVTGSYFNLNWLNFELSAPPADSDNDGVPDGVDQCPNTPTSATVDSVGCPIDSDGDGIDDTLDTCSNTPAGAEVDSSGCPLDSDNDGVFDGIDQCANTPEGATVNSNGCPADSDSDGVFDGLDQCPDTPAGAIVDGVGCPSDSDNDGIFDGVDQCANTPSSEPVSSDGCPLDTDNDGVTDGADQCPDTPNGASVNSTGCPSDSDNDGVFDGIDQCANSAVGSAVDATGCPADTDNDGVIDDMDLCPNTQSGSVVDTDGCAIDSDNDGVDDDLDQCPNTPSGTLVDNTGCEISLSVRIEAEDYVVASDSSNGNEAPAPNDCVYNGFNVDVGDTDDEGGGCSIGWIEAGESLTYDISLSAGTYSISSRVASDLTGGAFELYLDGNLIATDSIPSTGGWGSYETHQLGDLEVAGGDYTLHVEVTGSYFNLNWLNFELSAPPADSDNDGVPDGVDQCPNTPTSATVDSVGCPIDSDGDGIDDTLDTCSNTPAGAEVDSSGCPLDSDNDGVFDGIDQCANTPEGATVNSNGCPADSDSDGVFDGLDQCPDTPAGAIVDGVGCPSDSDNDGVFDGIDQCTNSAIGSTVDATGCPSDTDNDGVIDDLDLCPSTQPGSGVDANGCAIDSDGDGIDDDLDQCPNTSNGTLVDSTGCEISLNVRVEAEDYIVATDTTNGNEAPAPSDCVYNGLNVDVGDTDDEGGGCFIGWIESGESLTYDLSLSAGTYSITSRVASDLTQGEFELYLDGVLIATDSIPNTGGWDAFETHDLGVIEVDGGAYALQVEITGSYFNLNWLNFELDTPMVDSDSDGVPDSLDQCPNTPAGAVVDSTGCEPPPGDNDADGVNDDTDECPATPIGATVDGVGCPMDSDGDGVYDGIDQCADTASGTSVNSLGCPLTGVPVWTGAPPPEADFQTLPLATGVNLPMELDIAKNGELYVIGRLGEFYAFINGDLQQTAIIPTNPTEEGGLIGFALDPDFVENRYAYFHYTDESFPVQHVSRITVLPDQSLDMASEVILLSYDVQLEECCHVAGSLEFDGQGNLYIATGDNTNPFESEGYAPIDERPGSEYFDAQRTAANTNDLRGKILRITPSENGSYSIPNGNLFTEDASHRGEIFTMGHRNPFRLVLDPLTNELFWGEVGPDSNQSNPNRGPAGYDEINRTLASGNFGWPYFSGANEAYNDFDFSTENSGVLFDPSNVVNDSPNNTGALNLPNAQPAWITLSHRATMLAGVYRWDNSIQDQFKLPSYFHGRLIYWNFNNDNVLEVDVDSSGTPSPRLWMNPQLVDGIIDAKISPQNHRMYMLAYGGNCCENPPFAGILMEVRYTGSGPDEVMPSSYYAVNLGGDIYTDTEGEQFEAHGYSDTGINDSTAQSIANTPDEQIYQQQWTNNDDINLQFPVEDGNYSVVLKFADISGGNNVFNIDIERQTLAANVDVNAVVGFTNAYDMAFNVSVFDGVLNIDLLQQVGQPSIAGVVIRKQGEFPPTSTVSLRASNGSYVTVAPSLQVNASAVSNDEIFEVVDAGAGQVALRSASTGAYLSVANAGMGSLLVNATSVGSTEIFNLLQNSDGSYSIRYVGDGRYVSLSAGAALALLPSLDPEGRFSVRLADVCDGPSAYGIDCRPDAMAYLNMPVEPSSGYTNVPALLSETGAFSDVVSLTPSASLIPYEPIAKLWSDRAGKQRWVAIPSGEKVQYQEEGKWAWPAGTVFVKHFALPVDEQNPNALQRLETRLLVMQEGGSVYGVTYKWRADNSDADLQIQALNEDVLISSTEGDWAQTWSYPGASDCLICHNSESTGVLGLKSASLNSDLLYPSGETSNQIATWNHLEIFNEELDELALPAIATHAALEDTSATVEQRLRSYWDINCGFCHGPQGIAALWDARFETPLAEQGIVSGALANQRDYFDDYGLSEPFVIDPGNPSNSIMFIRDNSEEVDDRMPPLGRNLIHEEYMQLLEQWIISLP